MVATQTVGVKGQARAVARDALGVVRDWSFVAPMLFAVACEITLHARWGRVTQSGWAILRGSGGAIWTCFFIWGVVVLGRAAVDVLPRWLRRALPVPAAGLALGAIAEAVVFSSKDPSAVAAAHGVYAAMCVVSAVSNALFSYALALLLAGEGRSSAARVAHVSAIAHVISGLSFAALVVARPSDRLAYSTGWFAAFSVLGWAHFFVDVGLINALRRALAMPPNPKSGSPSGRPASLEQGGAKREINRQGAKGAKE